ncbi:MAG: hypothetical protein HZA16_12275 [Nitrospirae bacterium]|nr:hypothetical protein [Nitrospirota bacterium]
MKKPGTIFLLLAAAVVFSFPVTGINSLTGGSVVFAQEAWKGEFEAICSKTQDAMTFSPEELKDLITRCDNLKPAIEKLDETQRKVYLKRLQLCRELFVFVLGSKENR